MIALGAIAPYIESMHVNISFMPTSRSGRVVVPAVGAFFYALLMAAPALAQEMPAGGRTGSLLNILLLAALAFFLVRSFRRRGGGGDTKPGGGTPTQRNDAPDDEGRERPEPPTMDRHEAARRTWDILGSKDAESPAGMEQPEDMERPAPSTPTGVSPDVRAAGFDEVEFLEGAKLFYARFQQARSAGDFQGIRDFISDDVLSEALAVTGREKIEVMLLSARLMELKSESGRTRAVVFYDAQLRKGEQGERTEHVRHVWEFSRDDGMTDALWVLERIDRVDQ